MSSSNGVLRDLALRLWLWRPALHASTDTAGAPREPTSTGDQVLVTINSTEDVALAMFAMSRSLQRHPELGESDHPRRRARDALGLISHAEDYRVEYNTVRPHEHLSWNRPLDVHTGLADPRVPNFPNPNPANCLTRDILMQSRGPRTGCDGLLVVAICRSSRAPVLGSGVLPGARRTAIGAHPVPPRPWSRAMGLGGLGQRRARGRRPDAAVVSCRGARAGTARLEGRSTIPAVVDSTSAWR